MDPSEAKANFSRVCQLLVDKGGDALRAVLHAIHPPSTLAAVLKCEQIYLATDKRDQPLAMECTLSNIGYTRLK